MYKKILCLALSLCLLAAGLAGCGKNQEDAGKAGEKVFVFGDTTFNPENNEPDINPHRENGGWACIRYGVGETLFRYSDAMEIEPWLAKSYENVDPCTWKIVLRDGISFTSGRALDAQAVKECLERLVSLHKRAAGDLSIASMEADGQTLIIKTKVPVPALLNYLSDPYGCIIDVQAGVTDDGIVAGTGPYRAVSLASGKQIELVKNENYWNGRPKVDKIVIKTITDGDTLTAEQVNVDINPPNISLLGDQNTLASLTEINLGTIDLDTVRTGVAIEMEIPLPDGVRRHDVRTAREMFEAAQSLWSEMDLGAFSAAVADFSPVPYGEAKFKKEGASDGFSVSFASNPDILRTLSLGRREGQKVLGFAAETAPDMDALMTLVRGKRQRKQADLLAGNAVNAPGCGFGTDSNSMAVLDKNGHEEIWTSQSKADVAWKLWSWLLRV